MCTDHDHAHLPGYRYCDGMPAVHDVDAEPNPAIVALYRRLIETALDGAGEAAEDMRGALRDAGFDPDMPDLLDVIEGLHTTTETKAQALHDATHATLSQTDHAHGGPGEACPFWTRIPCPDRHIQGVREQRAAWAAGWDAA